MNSIKPTAILGINEGQNASAALSINGQIMAAAQEERFSRIKNHSGYPQKAIEFCLNFAQIKPSALNLVVLSYKDPYVHFTYSRAQEKQIFAPPLLIYLRNIAPIMEYHFPFLNWFFTCGRKLYYQLYEPHNQHIQIQDMSKMLKITPSKIIRIDHHLTHALSGYYIVGDPKKKQLIFTCDGAGDQLCASVSVAQGGIISHLAQTPHAHSLGLLYAAVTAYLGMKPHEDEYKVMGLAPYATRADIAKIYALFTSLLWIEELKFNTRIPSWQFNFFLKEKLFGFRFDHIAQAIQKFTEDILCAWVKNAIIKTGISDIICAGGVFLNVKANLKISQLPEVTTFNILPSPGDESNALGAALHGYMLHSKKLPKPLKKMYLGPDFSKAEIQKSFKKYPYLKKTKLKNLQPIVGLLEQGEIIARFSGHMEFGARALGNRSILADPRKLEALEKINNQIKQRDFWMPFAATILKESATHYLKNQKNISAPFMIMAFETTEKAQNDLKAALHPYDKTVRPQILERQDNPSYYELIDLFRKKTGVGGLLNTSLNLHGEPLVCTPADALSTFVRSGLNYLLLEDYLITK